METRKRIPKSSLARLYYIDREIASGKYPNVNDLSAEYECGTATIYRDIEYMKERLNAPIKYDAKRRGWYYAEKSFRLPARYAAANDMAALGMAKSLLALYRNTPLYESAKRLLDDITAPLTSDDTEDGDAGKAGTKPWYESRIVVPPVASAKVDPQTWEIITSALRDNTVITFEYKGLRDKESRTRLVRPYQLIFDTGVWYLYAWCEQREAVRLFSLPRIKNAALTNETFRLPKDFDYTANYTASHFGVYFGQSQHYRILFSNEAAPEIEERQWAADQKIEEAEDDCFILDFTSSQYGKVLAWVLSFGTCAAPLEPPELVEEWESNIDDLHKYIIGE